MYDLYMNPAFRPYRMPEFGELLESLLEDTLSNVITEAYGGEFQITAKRRLIALPPPSAPATASTIH